MTPRTSAGQRLLDWLGGVGVVANDELRRRVAEVEAEAEALDRDRLLEKARRWREQGMLTDSEWGVVMGVLFVDDIVTKADMDWVEDAARRLREAD